MSSTHLRDVREQRRDIPAALAVLLELPRARSSGVSPLVNWLTILPKLVGQRLAVVLFERRLGIERVDLARAADHEQEDDRLRLGREVRRLRRPAD